MTSQCDVLGINAYEEMVLLSGQQDSFQCFIGFPDSTDLQFHSVHEFYEFRQIDLSQALTEVIIHESDLVESRLQVKLKGQSEIRIIIKQKLNNDTINQDYFVQSAYAYLSDTLWGMYWQHISFEWKIINGVVAFDLNGRINQRFYINQVGIKYSDFKHFKIVLDQFTGAFLMITEVDL
ncbi:MAG: hypothetical protein HKN00_05325 [Flavobacteriaceae bacterium]|nr:hypothetical protein [Bacteroidia bacterium]MBT8287880.1 hypothetical protein [Bacteroidia bacterium]NNF74583.1 hypothetical protein [Flavobacteriaceae bacterium]NNK88570.1 hypothetical protein [Flavobacteriaceae bacterium]